MRAAVRPQFDLGQEWDDKGTLRDHLEAAEAATGRTPARLRTPPIPDCFDRHLRMWLELHARRQVGMAGLQPLSWPDLHAYTAVTRERLTKQDLHWINVIEEEFFASRNEAQTRKDGAASAKTVGAGNGQHNRARDRR